MRSHGDKIAALLENPRFEERRAALLKIEARYRAWRTASESISARDDRAIQQLTKLLNAYKDFLDDPCLKDRRSGFSPQTFLHSSVLEEFCALLLDPLRSRTALDMGGKRTYVEMQFRPRDLRHFLQLPPIVVMTKDQDFAFGKEVLLTCAYAESPVNSLSTFVPVVCLECKTNFDKTMYTAACDTARSIKQGAPACYYAVVMEINDLSSDFSPQGAPIDQIYWLRHPDRGHSRSMFEKRSPIDWRTVARLYCDVERHLTKTWFDPQQGEKTGVLI